MKIQTNNNLYYSIEHMLQGLAYWLGYRWECYAGHSVMEAVAVDVAIGILNCHLDHSMYYVKQEYGYCNILGTGNNDRMDLAIVEKNTNTCVCAIEFKLSTDANGGLIGDIGKLRSLPNSMFKLAVLVSQKETKLTKGLLTNNGNAKRNVFNIPNTSIIRAAKAMETSGMSKRPFRVICVEVQ